MKTKQCLISAISSFALSTVAAIAILGTQTTLAYAEASPAAAVQQVQLPQGEFVQRSKRLKGSYEIVQENGQTLIRFSDDFKTVNGPDLKVFLSPNSIDAATGQNATDGALLLGFVKSKKGTQDYVLPADISLANFGSILIHCEAFSVLWGGGNL
jgi:hypothetical protein